MNEIERMLIERSCERLVQQYCHWIDSGQAARVVELFTDDAVWAAREASYSGIEEIQRAFQARQDNHSRMSRHVCTSLLVDVVDEMHATGVVYLTLYRHDGDPARHISPAQAPTMVGEYRDEYFRTDAGWKFKRRDVVISFAGGNKGHDG